jgi:hypothetical protein
MKQKIEARYPASSDVVIKAMTDKKFHCDRLELQGHKTYEVVSHKADGKNFSIKFKRNVPIAAPAAVKKFVSAQNIVIHEDSWNLASKKGAVTVEIQGMPIELSAVTSLRDEGKGCVMTYDWEIKSKIPLVGGTIEKAVAAENEKAIPEQTNAGIQLLKNYQ